MKLQELEKLVIAFSGGVDSSFLLKIAHDVLKDGVIAVTATSSTYPEREYKEAIDFAKELGVEHIVINSEELDIPGFSENPHNRCYFCKKELFEKISNLGKERGIKHIADASNIDDLKDYRPGMTALKELGIISPLREAGFTKEEIRTMAKEMNLKIWDKPAFACLASRFPYGEKITKDKLNMIDRAEDFLIKEGFRQVRVRLHDNMARIEVPPMERHKFFSEDFMDKVSEEFKKMGFAYTALDLKGYRTGSMNETLGTAHL